VESETNSSASTVAIKSSAMFVVLLAPALAFEPLRLSDSMAVELATRRLRANRDGEGERSVLAMGVEGVLDPGFVEGDSSETASAFPLGAT
jgi:hypothetical protein